MKTYRIKDDILRPNSIYKRKLLVIFACILAFTVSSVNSALAQSQTIIWKLNNLKLISGHQPFILGNPVLINDDNKKSISFNGINDGLVLDNNQIEGLEQFTIEVLLKPDSKGPFDPRFIHFEDKEGNRGTMEMRINHDKTWYLDTFLKNGDTTIPNHRLTLIDSTKTHAADKWVWVAMIYDGEKMASFVNGIKELEGVITFPATKSGKTSLGVRLNEVKWFKGLISEIRFHSIVLDQHTLQKIK